MYSSSNYYGDTRYRQELRTVSTIALPLIFAALVNMGISITDVVMIGWLSPTEPVSGPVGY